MIFLKRRALMARAQFNYKIANGSGSLILKNCKKSLFKRFEIHGKSTQVTTTGVNLIPFKVGESIASKNREVTGTFREDGIDAVINNKQVGDVYGDLYFWGNADDGIESGYVEFKPGTYVIFFNSKTFTYCVILWRNGTKLNLITNSSINKQSFTIKEGDKVRIFIRPKGNIITTEKVQIMLVNDTTVAALPYEPYTGGKPSPSPEYTQEIESVGKKSTNLIDVKITGKNMFNIDGFPYKHDCETIVINSKEATEYEPYHEPQTVKIQLDEPLRGIGQYKDVITKDGIKRKIGHLERKGGLTWNERGNQFRIIVHVEKGAILYSKYLCNYTNDVKNFGNQHYIYLYFTKGQIEAIGINTNDTLEVANKKLNEIVANKPIVIEYPLKTPIFEPFPPEIQTKLSSLYTNEGTTVVTIDGGEVQPDIEVEYAAEKEKLAYI